jgi:hypothetical protein
MTVPVSNTELSTDTFNSWRLNTNLLSTIVSNNAVTIAAHGRGGFTSGNGHVDGVFSSTTLRATNLAGGNTAGTDRLTVTSNTFSSTDFLIV